MTCGTGYYYPPYIGYPMGAYPIYHPYATPYGVYGAYGSTAYYHTGTGAYGVSQTAYGPYGSATRSASYNPYTGTATRSASVSTPYGKQSVGQAYNPYTGSYGATHQGSSPTAQWGSYTCNKETNRLIHNTIPLRTERSHQRKVRREARRTGHQARTGIRPPVNLQMATCMQDTTETYIRIPAPAGRNRMGVEDGLTFQVHSRTSQTTNNPIRIARQRRNRTSPRTIRINRPATFRNRVWIRTNRPDKPDPRKRITISTRVEAGAEVVAIVTAAGAEVAGVGAVEVVGTAGN